MILNYLFLYCIHNDNNSTTPESTISSLSSLKTRYPDRNIILIAGGADKEFNYQRIGEYISEHIYHAFLFSGKASEKICTHFPSTYKSFTKVLSMPTAFNLALRQAENGDIITRTFCRLIPFDRISFLFVKNGIHDYLSKTKVVKDTAE